MSIGSRAEVFHGTADKNLRGSYPTGFDVGSK